MLLGCIADDFTGATDIASLLSREGMRVVQTIGVPDFAINDADAVVVALKSRTAPVDQAVSESLKALRWLQAKGCAQYFLKICSTFDSTPKGNIGPVMDALMSELGTTMAVVCPAFPENGRTVYQGHLFVGNRLLSESGMENHPLTPMSDSSLLRLLQPQTRQKVGLVEHSKVLAGPVALKRALDEASAAGCGAIVVDAITQNDMFTIGEACADVLLITGGSGVALGIPENFRRAGRLSENRQSDEMPKDAGRTAMIAGSCSEATRTQVKEWLAHAPGYRINPEQVMAGVDVVADAAQWAQGQRGDFLIYSTASPEEVRRVQAGFSAALVSERLEQTLADIAGKLAGSGCKRFVIAGGETSGAVVRKLGVKALRIGPSIAPGVPWTYSVAEPFVSLVLKSGNFGGPRFFADALALIK